MNNEEKQKKSRVIGSSNSQYNTSAYSEPINKKMVNIESRTRKVIDSRQLKNPRRAKKSFFEQFFPYLVAILVGFFIALIAFFIISSNGCSSSAFGFADAGLTALLL